MNNEEGIKVRLNFQSLKKDGMTLEDVYNQSYYDGYEICTDVESYDNRQIDVRSQRFYDLGRFKFPSSFVSIDFENFFPQRLTVCSVGMVKYKNGIIVDKYYSLIRPPFEYEGKKGSALTWIHGLTEDMLEGERIFPEILPEMESFIENLPLVAHNACVERACIQDACAFYNIMTSIPYEDILDTYLLSKAIEERLGLQVYGIGSHSLDVVCKRFGVKELNHHHAGDDAEMCGNLFLTFPKFLSGELVFDDSAWQMVSTSCSKETTSPISTSYKALASKGHSVLCGDILQKDLTDADPNNPFYDRVVVITGVFNIERMKLAQILKSMGADINTSVGGKTNYLLIGKDPGPSKMRKVDELIDAGKDVRKIYQEDLDLILSGKCFDKYHTENPIASKTKVVVPNVRKTTWPQLVKKYKQYVNSGIMEFTEQEMQSEDYRLLSLYYKQQQKIATTKETILCNLRELDEISERKFRKDIYACFTECEKVSKEEAYERMQNVFTKYNLNFKAKTCVLVELGIEFEEFKVKGIHHLSIKKIPNY